MSDKTISLKCPTCEKAITWSADFSHKPFCSHRCKLIDLGEWANESHRIPGQAQINDEDPNLVPKDVVLYGFGRIGRLAARELIKNTAKGQQLRLRAIVKL